MTSTAHGKKPTGKAGGKWVLRDDSGRFSDVRATDKVGTGPVRIRVKDSLSFKGVIKRKVAAPQPNKTTVSAIVELRKGGGHVLKGSIKDLMAELNDGD